MAAVKPSSVFYGRASSDDMKEEKKSSYLSRRRARSRSHEGGGAAAATTSAPSSFLGVIPLAGGDVIIRETEGVGPAALHQLQREGSTWNIDDMEVSVLYCETCTQIPR